MFTRKDFDYVIKHNHSFALISHAKPDWDAIGSILWLWWLLESLWKSVVYHTPTHIPKQLQFVPWWQKISSSFTYQTYDVIIFCDEPNPFKSKDSVIVGYEKYFDKHLTLSIDHHIGWIEYTTHTIKEITRVSTSDMVAEYILDYHPHFINKDSFTALLMGIITDSGSYRRPSTTAQTLQLSSRLIEKWADLAYVQYHCANIWSFANLELAKIILHNIVKLDHFVYTRIDLESIINLWLEQEDIQSSFELIRQIPFCGACAHFVIKKDKDNQQIIWCSLRSNNTSIDLNVIAKQFGWGGHKSAAWCIFHCTSNPQKSIIDAAHHINNAISTQLKQNTNIPVVSI